jgi:hypothetical protein
MNLVKRKDHWQPYVPGENPQRRSGLGRPIGEGAQYIVRVFYGGDYCDESLEGPFATIEEATLLAREQWGKGYGALVCRCTNVTALAMKLPEWKDPMSQLLKGDD